MFLEYGWQSDLGYLLFIMQFLIPYIYILKKISITSIIPNVGKGEYEQFNIQAKK